MGPLAAESSTGCVLLATADPVLRASRAALLRSFGFHTTSSTSAEHAIELIQFYTFDLLVLGSSLTAEDCGTISAAFREKHPRGRVIEILPGSAEGSRDNPNETVVGLDGPLALRRVVLAQMQLARAARN